MFSCCGCNSCSNGTHKQIDEGAGAQSGRSLHFCLVVRCGGGTSFPRVKWFPVVATGALRYGSESITCLNAWPLPRPHATLERRQVRSNLLLRTPAQVCFSVLAKRHLYSTVCCQRVHFKPRGTGCFRRNLRALRFEPPSGMFSTSQTRQTQRVVGPWRELWRSQTSAIVGVLAARRETNLHDVRR